MLVKLNILFWNFLLHHLLALRCSAAASYWSCISARWKVVMDYSCEKQHISALFWSRKPKLYVACVIVSWHNRLVEASHNSVHKEQKHFFANSWQTDLPYACQKVLIGIWSTFSNRTRMGTSSCFQLLFHRAPVLMPWKTNRALSITCS